MKKNELWRYLAPAIKVLKMCVEQGFAGSQLGGVDSDPTSPGESPILPGEDTDW